MAALALETPKIREGILDKKLKIQGFQSRYFVLRTKTLFYYKSQAEADSHPDKPLGVIPLKGALIEAPHGRSAHRPAFRLSFKEANVRRRRRGPLGRSNSVESDDDGVAVKHAKYVLSATSVEEKVAWEDALREQIWKASTSDEDQEKKERRLSGIEKPDLYKPMNIQAVIEEDEEEEELDEDDDD